MNQFSPETFAARIFRGGRASTAAIVAASLCLVAGCGDDSTPLEPDIMNLDSDFQFDVSVLDSVETSGTPTVSPPSQAETSNDQFEPPSSDDITAQNATKNEATADSDVATEEPLVETEDAPKKPAGTKLPKDFLEGSELTPLNPQKTVLLDIPGKRVLLKARVCLTEGLLEMLLCPHQTKEHESILSTESQAFTVHTGLLALGCKEGKAARYDSETEKYTPASGQIIDVFLHWMDTEGKLHRERAQNWVRGSTHHYYSAEFKILPKDLKLVPDGNLRYDDVNQYLFWYGPMTDEELAECLKMSSDEKFQAAMKQFHKDGLEKPMTADWVFVGSGFYEDGDAPKQYLAEGGYMICVANFAMAMLDVATPSDSNGTESLSYEAATDRIPPRESEVMIELVPRPAKKADDENAAPAAAADKAD
ncbi:MAG: hypothetical protein ACI92S_001647 [Planctomycetaceae bacterium]|jgi:hypothetical protein